MYHHLLLIKELHLQDPSTGVLEEDQQEDRPSDLFREDQLQEEFDEGLRQIIKEGHQLPGEQRPLTGEPHRREHREDLHEDQQLEEELQVEDPHRREELPEDQLPLKGEHHRRGDLHEDLQQRPEGLLGLESLLEAGHVLQDLESLRKAG